MATFTSGCEANSSGDGLRLDEVVDGSNSLDSSSTDFRSQAEAAMLEKSDILFENAELVVRVTGGHVVDEEVLSDIEKLLPASAFAGKPGKAGPNASLVEYIGKIGVAPFSDEPTIPKMSDDAAAGPNELPESMIFTANGTFNEFKVTRSRAYIEKIVEQGRAEALVRDGLDDTITPGYNITDSIDTRTRLYSIDGTITANEHRPQLRIVGGGGSGVMYGPRHFVTAAHVLFTVVNNSIVVKGSLSFDAGRNGTNWLSSATGWTWLSRDSAYDPISGSGDSARDFAWGVPNARIGDTTGWLLAAAWAESHLVSNSAQLRNAGYPSCGLSESPVSCQTNHLYSDNNNCERSGYYSPDSDSWNRGMRHSCDTSQMMSGSPLYFTSGGNRYVWGIHRAGIGTDHFANRGSRITPQRFAMLMDAKNNLFP